ncbi:hypothetical protein CHL76_15930 [Marinococcus halophilus]|uniref:DUF262 domain-containing protein n=1 Tax=Marinococcus halophilus TaxID=1371 RepID=A0A510Y9Y3_MARHA|nr:hypothetical protein [Marinococcus halophilus]OZT78828.1 hypothetical protein CHL76_15930 [Marinococcus halophilus]GEK60194.1 hypothetical protein MHA01_30990 [Marinococcus halophilus]
MKVIILDEKIEESEDRCYLCSSTLKEYINSLPNDYKDYDIQRGIVSNLYLDNLVETILTKGHIPPITLVVYQKDFPKNDNIEKFRILDGLQRTYRLKVIWDTIQFIIREGIDHNSFSMNKYQLSRKFKSVLSEFGSNTSILYKLLQISADKKITPQKLISYFNEKQWFEIWVNLSPDKEIKKMLVLNAGHKQMSLKHQLELYFLNLLPIVNEIGEEYSEDFKLYREREVSSAQFTKKRKKGEFYFPHLISSILSFVRGEVITTNTKLVREINNNEDTKLDEFLYYLNQDFIKGVIKFLIELDEILIQDYDEIGEKWISRETVAVGIFGALGRASQQYETLEDRLSIFTDFIRELETSKENLLNVAVYNEARNSIDLSKENVGNLTKKSVYHGITELINNSYNAPIDWRYWFLKKEDNSWDV